jgi:hypothetical protein
LEKIDDIIILYLIEEFSLNKCDQTIVKYSSPILFISLFFIYIINKKGEIQKFRTFASTHLDMLVYKVPNLVSEKHELDVSC